MDEQQEHEQEQVNLVKYPVETNHKIHDKLSGSHSDSGLILANIRKKTIAKAKKYRKAPEAKNEMMQEYMTYKAINFESKRIKNSARSSSREKVTSLSSRSMQKHSASVSGSDKKRKIMAKDLGNKKSVSSLSKRDDKISLTSIVPSTITSLRQDNKSLNVRKNKSK